MFNILDLQDIRKLLDTEAGGETCPSCQMPFDKGKKRKLIDNCGHGRCYSCMFKSEECPLCQAVNYNGKNGKYKQEILFLFFFLNCSHNRFMSFALVIPKK